MTVVKSFDGDVSVGGAALEAKNPVTRTAKHLRAYRLLVMVLLLRPFGNLSLAWGMRHFSQVLAMNPFIYVMAMFNPYVALGIVMLTGALLTRMALLSLADLSFVLPLTATGYIFSTLLGKFFLHEDVSTGRWLGTLLIFAGTALVASTSQRTNSESINSGEDKLLPEAE